MVTKFSIVSKSKIKHWVLIVAAVVVGFFLPLIYYRGDDIKMVLSTKIFSVSENLTIKDLFSENTYIAARSSSTIVYASSTGRYYRVGRRKEPNVSASSFLVSDLETGQIIMEKNPGVILPVASITKLMTSVVSLENLNQNQVAQVSAGAMQAFGLAGQLKEGEKFKVSDLLYPLLLESSNKTAEVLAETGGRADFLKQMNQKAEVLKMNQTSFADPSGLSAENVSTALDLSRLAKYIYDHHPAILNITRERKRPGYGRVWYNKNNLVNFDSYMGGKDGFTYEAQKTVISLFSLPLAKNHNRPVVIILLHSKDKTKDTQNLLRYIHDEVYYTG